MTMYEDDPKNFHKFDIETPPDDPLEPIFSVALALTPFVGMLASWLIFFQGPMTLLDVVMFAGISIIATFLLATALVPVFVLIGHLTALPLRTNIDGTRDA